MKSGLTRGIAAAILFAATSTAFAAAPVVKVSLLGEAGQPMSIKLDTQTVKAGAVEFDVSNDAIGTDHEVVLVKLAPGEAITAIAKNHRVDESKLQSMGEVSSLTPGKSGKLNVTLAAGDYVLLCNHTAHYELGMETPFTVTK